MTTEKVQKNSDPPVLDKNYEIVGIRGLENSLCIRVIDGKFEGAVFRYTDFSFKEGTPFKYNLGILKMPTQFSSLKQLAKEDIGDFARDIMSQLMYNEEITFTTKTQPEKYATINRKSNPSQPNQE